MNKKKNHLGFVRELIQTNVVMMEASGLHNYKQVLTKNFNAHVSSEEIDAELPEREQHFMLKFIKGSKNVNGIQFFNNENILCERDENGNEIAAKEPKEDEERVLVLNMIGPVTRCGGMCSYGSMDFRDILIDYAEDEKTVGMVLVTDTPGGVCFAMHDFEQGMDAWNKAGKRSIQFIDGTSFSAGVAIGSQCQKIIAMNKKDGVGCIGAMLAGWTTQDGTHDSDGNRYIDITATQTPDKNAGIRDAANGDYEKLQREVNECCTDFLNLLNKCRPQITEEQRTGKIYNAGDVIGTLVDGIGDFNSAMEYARTGEETWETNNVDDPNEQPEGAPNEQPDDAPNEQPMDDQNKQPEEQQEKQVDEQNENESEKLKAMIGSRFEDLLQRIEAMNLQMQQHKQSTDERIKELEQEKNILQSENEKLQKDLLKSNEELNSMQMEVPSPAIPATRQVKEKKENIPSRINDSMTPKEKLAAWNNRGNQLAKSRMA